MQNTNTQQPTRNLHTTPHKAAPKAAPKHNAHVLAYQVATNATLGNTKGWATMVAVGNAKRPQVVTAINYGPQGNPIAYQVHTRAGLVALVPATACGATYTGWATQGPHYGVCKLAVAMGMVNGFNRYAQ